MHVRALDARDPAAQLVGERTGELTLAFALETDLVPPDLRGRGYGSAMLDHVVDVARGHGRARMVASVHTPYDGPADGTGHPDRDWAARRGFELDISNVVRVLQLPVPDDILEEFGRLVGALMVEARSGQVDGEHEVMDLERIRSDEAVFEASGRVKYTTVAGARDGRLAAYSELVVPRHDPRHVYQWGTLVRPTHRGHRLGRATKVHNLRWAQQEAPDRTSSVRAL
jgi:GNAT superfamily N-acetyltransferase